MKKTFQYFLITFIGIASSTAYAQKYSSTILQEKKGQVSHIADSVKESLIAKQNFFSIEKPALSKSQYKSQKNNMKELTLRLNEGYRSVSKSSQQKALKKILATANTSKEDGLDGNLVKIDLSDKTKIAVNTSVSLFQGACYFTSGLTADAKDKVSELFSDGNLKPNVAVTPGIIIPVIVNPIRKRQNIKPKSVYYLKAQESYYTKSYVQEYEQLIAKAKIAEDSANAGNYTFAFKSMDSLKVQANKYNIYLDFNDVIDSIETKINDDLFEIEFVDNPDIAQTKTAWISINSSYGKIKFKTFNDQWSFSDKIGERSFDKWALSASWNYYFLRHRQTINYKKTGKCMPKVKSFFLSASITFAKSHVWEDLTPSEITINRYQKTQNDTTLLFQEKENLIDVTTTPYEYNESAKPSVFIHLPFFNSKFVKFNAGFAAVIAKKSRPLYEPKLALLYNVQDASKDDKSLVSFELFLKVNDLFNAQKQKNIVDERETIPLRTVIGINATVPFAKLLFAGKNN